MKALITIVILALVAWGIWWFARGNDTEVLNDLGNNQNGEVQGVTDGSGDDVDLSQFESKG